MGMNIKTPVRVIQVYDGVYHLVDSDGNKLLTEQESVIDFEWLAMVINERAAFKSVLHARRAECDQHKKDKGIARKLLIKSNEKVKDLSLDLFSAKQALRDMVMIIDDIKGDKALSQFQAGEIENAHEILGRKGSSNDE